MRRRERLRSRDTPEHSTGQARQALQRTQHWFLLHEVFDRNDLSDDTGFGCLHSGCGWDQKVFSSISWKMQCQFADDNAMDAHAPPVRKADKSESCLRMRVLRVYSFPTGGNKRQFGILPPEYYERTKTFPVLVHCTGRTGLAAKLDCLKRVQSLYANCTSSLGISALSL
mgnify:CR=1 FL=1